MVQPTVFVEWSQDWPEVRVGECEFHGEKWLGLYYGDKIFAAVDGTRQPVRLELRCDERLGGLLKERYESVMAGRILGRNGIEIVCSGQLSEDELKDLLRHAYETTRANGV